MTRLAGLTGQLGLLIGYALAASLPAHAQGDAERGAAHFALCVACHGPNGEGVTPLNAPASGGQDYAYVVRQMQNYRNGIRGTHPDDTFGLQMAPMAMVLPDDQAVEDVAAYIQTLPISEPPATIEGDTEAGRALYERTCVACHGEQAQGIALVEAPRLSNQHDWYLLRQIENFKAGVRGAHQSDLGGAPMAGMAQMLETEEQVRDVVAYIATLEYAPGK